MKIQIQLTAGQRHGLEEIARREQRSIADVIERAIDAWLSSAPLQEAALRATFGVLPDLEVPSRDGWDRAGPSSA